MENSVQEAVGHVFDEDRVVRAAVCRTVYQRIDQSLPAGEIDYAHGITLSSAQCELVRFLLEWSRTNALFAHRGRLRVHAYWGLTCAVRRQETPTGVRHSWRHHDLFDVCKGMKTTNTWSRSSHCSQDRSANFAKHVSLDHYQKHVSPKQFNKNYGFVET